MSYTDYGLVAPTEADAKNAAIDALQDGLTLVQLDPITNTYEWVTSSTAHAFDLIGPVVTTPGVYDEDGTEVQAPGVDTRFHANLRVKDAIAADVLASLTARGEPHGVIVGVETGRVWA